jgi:hypothetical protein
MKRLLMSAVVAGAITLGVAAPAGAGYICPPPPPPPCDHYCPPPPPPPPPPEDCTPGWGGEGGPKGGYAASGVEIPGGGAGDQNHTHCGPPGQASKAGF